MRWKRMVSKRERMAEVRRLSRGGVRVCLVVVSLELEEEREGCGRSWISRVSKTELLIRERW